MQRHRSVADHGKTAPNGAMHAAAIKLGLAPVDSQQYIRLLAGCVYYDHMSGVPTDLSPIFGHGLFETQDGVHLLPKLDLLCCRSAGRSDAFAGLPAKDFDGSAFSAESVHS